jgi:succinate dehydrogenase / fumarate reductase cytochrome b subunit
MKMEKVTSTLRGVPRQKSVVGWVDFRRRNVGIWAFVLNRLTGIGLTVYLFLHFAVFSTLLLGEETWNSFIALAKTPPFLLLDVVLLFGLLFHGLNGLRQALLACNIGVDSHKALFWVFMLVGAVALVYASVRVFTA